MPSIITIGLILIALPIAAGAYAYLVYPLVLLLLGRRTTRSTDDDAWPLITITVPCYNEARSIRQTLERLLALDYPADRRHILVISDASSDGTDDIVREFEPRGVELLRLPARAGKTAAENAAAARLRGTLVVNTDATIRIPLDSLKPLVRAFRDPGVGVASGRDVSVGNLEAEHNSAEAGYVGYEMWVRRLESRVYGIVGASGCFYGIRRQLYSAEFPEALSRDFASPLMAREHGFRSVSVDEAVCLVPRTSSLQAEYRRKIRTMARGLETLWYKRHLLNPVRYGVFAWMLASHKVCRWIVPLLLAPGAIGLGLLALQWPAVAALAVAVLAGAAIGAIARFLPADRPLPRPVALLGFALWSNVAALVAWAKALRGEGSPIWEPTRRPASH
jgi:cellulose synthase/poly-beta-1,6-N-acetylglucosamine synthase-like glycosyltransferase